jgi:hypothetical protein
MPGLIRREGEEDATGTVIVVEPVNDEAPPLLRRTVTDPLARADWLAAPWKVAPTGRVPLFERHVRLIIDHQFHPPRVNQVLEREEAELPHDEPAALRDFVESVYLLHGWETVRLHAADLERMVALRARPGPRSPFEDPGAVERANREDAVRRMGDADLAQVNRWRDAHGDATAELRLRVLAVMRKVEEEAVGVAGERLSASIVTVDEQTLRYFAFGDVHAAEVALERHAGAPRFDASRDDVKDLRERLTALVGPATKVAHAEQEVNKQLAIIGASTRGFARPPSLEPLKRAEADVVAAKAELSAAVAPHALEHPVLHRFNADELLEAEGASTRHLGQMVFERLSRTFVAAQDLFVSLNRRRPAKAAETTAVRAGALPEQAVGEEADKSVWLYRRLVEAAIDRLEDDAEAEIAAAAAENVLPFHEREELVTAVAETAATLTITGVAIVLHGVCPPAGLALDVGLSAMDVWRSTDEYSHQRADALCDLDPRACFAEPPSALPVVFAVAAAAMVVH